MKNKKYIVYLVVSILVLTIGVSYAYFKARVSGEGKSISLRSKGIYVLYSGDATLASESISPGWSVTKEFTVENQGSNNEVYNIYIEGLVNTFVTSGYLQYKITSSNGYNMSEYKDIPKSNTSTDTVLAYSVPIKSKEKQTYKVELIYKETEEDQSVDMGKILSGILGIQVGTKDPNLFTASVVVINGSSDTNSKEVYKGNDVTFTITPNEGYILEDASISCSNGTLANNLLTISKVQSDVNCTITLDEDGPYKSGTLAAQILKDNPTIKTRTDFSVANTETTTGTIYVQSSTATNRMTEDTDGDGIGEDVYYYSGNTTNNWVKFGSYIKDYELYRGYYSNDATASFEEFLTQSACRSSYEYHFKCNAFKYASVGDDMYWRIVRINEDGSVRMLYSGTSPDTTNGRIGSAHFNNQSQYSNRIGYMYGDLQSDLNNKNDSLAKTFIDTWYKNYLVTDYDKYISKTAIYCNDRNSCAEKSGISRLSRGGKPSYMCGSNGKGGLVGNSQSQLIKDKFSASTTGGGNGQLKYPIALITTDEIIFAGESLNSNGYSSKKSWYSVNSEDTLIYGIWWTMTPSIYDGSWSYLGTVNNSGSKGSTRTDFGIGIRPVISLKACVKYASGDGSSNNPYEVTIDTTCSN